MYFLLCVKLFCPQAVYFTLCGNNQGRVIMLWPSQAQPDTAALPHCSIDTACSQREGVQPCNPSKSWDDLASALPIERVERLDRKLTDVLKRGSATPTISRVCSSLPDTSSVATWGRGGGGNRTLVGNLCSPLTLAAIVGRPTLPQPLTL
ncbi:hypothetical protein BX600DRAFT_245942 [Xylariales sp. PMI_506]|nr:hypothetical protein BX600DRAFT_245942 [Xylariales sp. PMI_506]